MGKNIKRLFESWENFIPYLKEVLGIVESNVNLYYGNEEVTIENNNGIVLFHCSGVSPEQFLGMIDLKDCSMTCTKNNQKYYLYNVDDYFGIGLTVADSKDEKEEYRLIVSKDELDNIEIAFFRGKKALGSIEIYVGQKHYNPEDYMRQLRSRIASNVDEVVLSIFDVACDDTDFLEYIGKLIDQMPSSISEAYEKSRQGINETYDNRIADINASRQASLVALGEKYAECQEQMKIGKEAFEKFYGDRVWVSGKSFPRYMLKYLEALRVKFDIKDGILVGCSQSGEKMELFEKKDAILYSNGLGDVHFSMKDDGSYMQYHDAEVGVYNCTSDEELMLQVSTVRYVACTYLDGTDIVIDFKIINNDISLGEDKPLSVRIPETATFREIDDYINLIEPSLDGKYKSEVVKAMLHDPRLRGRITVLMEERDLAKCDGKGTK